MKVRQWSFGRKIGVGFALVVALTVGVVAIAVVALNRVVSSKDAVIDETATELVRANHLHATRWELAASTRGYLLLGDEAYLNDREAAARSFAADLAALRDGTRDAEGLRLLDTLEQTFATFDATSQEAIELRRAGAGPETVNEAFVGIDAERDQLNDQVEELVTFQQAQLAAARQASSDTASSSQLIIVIIGVAAVGLAAIAGFLLTRSLRRQVRTTVSDVRSSSAELQVTARQQATGATEQASAMSEIATTINELLATSRQIADSAQRVVQIAEQTGDAGSAGESMVTKAMESMNGIRRQVDLVVSHVLDLGEKSQQIGAVLDLVSELAEQTNILAINATIEAAGAGQAGDRFAVVADEIRKLADRVAGSTKEVRALIDDVRGAVNTAVMATEIGSKAVTAGSGEFAELATSFRRIAGLVSTTTEAAREIELSTKQQTTAVEQVTIAIASVAQATRENEASSSQTLLTASQLSDLSSELQRLVEAPAGA